LADARDRSLSGHRLRQGIEDRSLCAGQRSLAEGRCPQAGLRERGRVRSNRRPGKDDSPLRGDRVVLPLTTRFRGASMTTLGVRPGETLSPVTPAPARASEVIELLLQATSLLYVNAETTEQTVAAGHRIAERLGERATVIPRWDELVVQVETDQ